MKKFNDGKPAKLELGGMVKLKSGGPDMTAAKILGEDVMCIWMDAKGVLMTENFAQDALEVVKPAQNTGLNASQNPDNIK